MPNARSVLKSHQWVKSTNVHSSHDARVHAEADDHMHDDLLDRVLLCGEIFCLLRGLHFHAAHHKGRGMDTRAVRRPAVLLQPEATLRPMPIGADQLRAQPVPRRPERGQRNGAPLRQVFVHREPDGHLPRRLARHAVRGLLLPPRAHAAGPGHAAADVFFVEWW